MRLENSTVIQGAPDEVFALVNDPARVVSCVPGASLQGQDGETYRGGMKVKVGPISAAYSGTVRFVEVDHAARTLRLVARGADTRGSGDASADVALRVEPVDGGARLSVESDVLIRGKIAQFGKGAIGAVAEKILQQFAINLGELMLSEQAGNAAPVSTGPAAQLPTAQLPAARGPQPAMRGNTGQAAELDGLALIVGPLVKRYGRPAALLGFGLLQGWVLGRAVTIERYYRRPLPPPTRRTRER